MVKKDKKVSISLFDKIAKEHFQNERVFCWHEAEVRVKYDLSLAEMLAFVDEVVKSCFHDKLGFLPEVKDFAVKGNILTRYANFSLPDNLEHRYQLIYGTNAVDAVCEEIDTDQLAEIVNSIDKKIRFLCDSKINLFQDRLSNMMDAMEEMQKKTSDVFDSISQEDMKALIGAVSEHGFDEQKIVKAYLDQKRFAQTPNEDAAAAYDGPEPKETGVV